MTDKALWPRALPDKCANPLKSSKPIPSKPFVLAWFSNSHFTASTQTSPQFPGPKKNAAIFLHQHLAGIPFSHVIALKNKPLGADAKIAQVAELICWISPLCLTSKVHCHNVRTQSSSSPWKVYCLSFFVVWQKKKDKVISMHFLNDNSSVPNGKCYIYVTSNWQSTQGKKNWHIVQFCQL